MSGWDVVSNFTGLGKGTAADFGFRWRSMALNFVRGFLGLDIRPLEPQLQRYANSLPVGNAGKDGVGLKGYTANGLGIGKDATEYAIKGDAFGLGIGEALNEAVSLLNDATYMLGNLAADPGRLLNNLLNDYDPKRGGWPGQNVDGKGPRDLAGRWELKYPKVNVVTQRYNQYLEDKGYLHVEYPSPYGLPGIHDPQGDKLKFKLPFFENPKITEKRKARYSSTNIFGRNEPLRLFTGADARQIQVSFKYTLPHILFVGSEFLKDSKYIEGVTDGELWTRHRAEFMEDLYRNHDTMQEGAETAQRRAEEDTGVGDYEGSVPASDEKLTYASDNPDWWENPDKPTPRDPRTPPTENDRSANVLGTGDIPHDSWRNKQAEGSLDGWKFPAGYHNRQKGFQWIFERKNDGEAADNSAKSLGFNSYNNLLLFVHKSINAIRTLVVGAVKEPDIGPPIVRVNFGTVFRNVPCICKDYTLKIDGDSGYDNDTLLPRVIEVRLNLEEYRQVGAFGKDAFDPAETPDGLPGWEDFWLHGSMDPPYSENQHAQVNDPTTEQDSNNPDDIYY